MNIEIERKERAKKMQVESIVSLKVQGERERKIISVIMKTLKVVLTVDSFFRLSNCLVLKMCVFHVQVKLKVLYLLRFTIDTTI